MGATGSAVTTVEGLSRDDRLHPLQQAWIEHSVPQCGYCQSGQLMTAAHLLATNPAPSREDIATVMSGNLCRCGTYGRMIEAIEGAVDYPYQVPHIDIRHTHVDPGVPITWWRSVGDSHNGFAVETFMDERAYALAEDQIEGALCLV